MCEKREQREEHILGVRDSIDKEADSASLSLDETNYAIFIYLRLLHSLFLEDSVR
jgi:hypothetical protein